MLRVAAFEEVQATLLRLPDLAELFEKRDPGFAGAVKSWLAAAEKLLASHRLIAAAELAGLRTTLISTERGMAPAAPQAPAAGSRMTSRKARDTAAAEVLRKAAEVIATTIRGDAARLEEAERLARQLATVALRKGLIAAAATGIPASARMAAIWSALAGDPELGPATAHLAALAGTQDAWLLVARALPAVAAVVP